MAHSASIEASNIDFRGHAPRLVTAARMLGLIGLVLTAIVGVAAISMGDGHARESIWRAYVANLCYFTAIGLGGLIFVLIQHATRAGWSVSVRRLAESTAGALPTMAMLAIPIVVVMLLSLPGIEEVYPWLKSGYDRSNAAYLNKPFFAIRMVVFFGIWIWLANFFVNSSVLQDQTGDVRLTSRMESRCYPGILLYALTSTFFVIDMLMSMNPHWYSTIFGVYYFSISFVNNVSVMALMIFFLHRAGFMRNVVSNEHLHDVGKLVFAFTVFWAYIGFSQYMLIWYASLPEETFWFMARQSGPWLYLSILLILGGFFIPFLGLISRHPKRRAAALAVGAAWVLVVHWFDILWLALPRANPEAGAVTISGTTLVFDLVLSLTAMIGIGGIFASAVLQRLGSASLVPTRDPRLNEALAFHNF
ncbi:MAG: hypothetical protein KDA32_03020 [Phycisphaerales bacterium]|nr:hypothetical protein [Phycisphaerales bacterium]